MECLLILSAQFVQAAPAELLPVTDEGRDVQQLLHRMQSAPQRVNFSGIFVYQQGSHVRTSRITHLLEGKNEVEKLEILDGPPREYLRHNDEIFCYLPEARTLLVENKVARDVFPAIFASNPAGLASYYLLKRGQMSRVAGHETQELVLEPRDNLRYGYRLSAEKSTGLVLKAQTMNEKNEVVEQITFTQIQIGNINKARLRPTFQNTSGWHVENSAVAETDAAGWMVNNIPPGFKRISAIKRTIVDFGSGTSKAAGELVAARDVTQLVYSDGVAALSVFIEPGSRSRTEGYMQQGATNIVGKRQGEFWLTIVGEIPVSAIRQVANSIEFKIK